MGSEPERGVQRYLQGVQYPASKGNPAAVVQNEAAKTGSAWNHRKTNEDVGGFMKSPWPRITEED